MEDDDTMPKPVQLVRFRGSPTPRRVGAWFVALATAMALIAGCGETPAPESSIGGMSVTPASATVAPGAYVQLDATLTGVVGRPDTGVTWSSTNVSVATVDGAGLVTAHAEGQATIRATSDFDTSITDTSLITVTVPGGDGAPTASLDVDADGTNVAPAVVRFDASASFDADGTIVSYAWTLDGEPLDETGSIVDLYLAEPATYSVAVTVTDDEGRSDTQAATTNVVDSGASFTIDIQFFDDDDMTLEQRRAFSSAARRWAEVVRSDFAPMWSPGYSCGPSPSYEGWIDDVVIFASITDIDGPGTILANAGPCVEPSDPFPPRLGVMRFDRADLDVLEDNSDLDGVALHEMGHVLGVGTMWNVTNEAGYGLPPKVTPTPCYDEADPRYIGTNAVREWQGISGQATDVPVEEGAQNGTSCGHWNEYDDQAGDPPPYPETRPDLYAELMTGYLDASMRLSTITVGALADLGYDVDYDAADPFSMLTLRGQAAPATPKVRLVEDLFIAPITKPSGP